MSFKSNNRNIIWYKQINSNLTINYEWRYLTIHDCCTKEMMKIFECLKLLLMVLSSNQNVLCFSKSCLSDKSSAMQSPKKTCILKSCAHDYKHACAHAAASQP